MSEKKLEAIHRAKTAALIRAAVRTGALCTGTRGRPFEHLSRYGEELGLAFQIVDDVLDVRSSSARLGKAAHKDANRRKATYPSVHGLEESERRAATLVEEACAELRSFGTRGEPLREIARYLLLRTA